uniref:Protein TIC 214 n=1 Tax=Downingia cuspidata TaxID=101772 RepID=A0A1Z2QT37_9ASTR|nr:hypothetical chloroplast RF1 [Downingia cuspidata]ASA34644.1 hypothetical chloroplast RF1 [Downingia cuspidata]
MISRFFSTFCLKLLTYNITNYRIQGGTTMVITKIFSGFLKTLTNSVLWIGLYYGFLTTFSIRVSYLFLFVEDPDQKASAITGFILGQLVRFMSIYSMTLHQLLWTPHLVTILFAPYVLFYCAFDNWEYNLSRATRTNLVVFLNTFIFQLANQILLPTSTLARLVNVYMFRCNNKMLFVISTFVGWLIGHICFLVVSKKVLDGIRIYLMSRPKKELVEAIERYIYTYFGAKFQVRFSYVLYRVAEFQKSINSELKKYKKQVYQYLSRALGQEFEFFIRGLRWIVSEIQFLLLINLRRNTGRFVNILLFTTSLYYLGKLPLVILPHPLKTVDAPPLTQTLLEPQDLDADTYWAGEKKEEEEEEEEDDQSKLEEIILERIRTQEQKTHPLWKEDKDLDEATDQNHHLDLDYPFVSIFCPFQWTRPVRYLANQHFLGAIRKETSQYFFNTGCSDGKKRISFTALPSLASFQEFLKGVIYSVERLSFDKFEKDWLSNNKERQKNLNNEFRKRIEALDRGFLFRDILEKRTRVCIDKKDELYLCLPTRDDPLLSGPSRGSKKILTDVETARHARRQQAIDKRKSEEKAKKEEQARKGEMVTSAENEQENIVEPPPESGFEQDQEEDLLGPAWELDKQTLRNRKKGVEQQMREDRALHDVSYFRAKITKIRKSLMKNNKKINQLPDEIKSMLGISELNELLAPEYCFWSPKYKERMLAIRKSKTLKPQAEEKLYSNPLSKFFVKPGEKGGRRLNRTEQILELEELESDISKTVPRWSYVLFNQLLYEMSYPFIVHRGKNNCYDVLSALYRYDLLVSESKGPPPSITITEADDLDKEAAMRAHGGAISKQVVEDYKKSGGNPSDKQAVLGSYIHEHLGKSRPEDQIKERDLWWVALTTASEQFWFQGEVKGSAIPLRRKKGVVTTQMKRYPHSPLFLGFLENLIMRSFKIVKVRMQNLMYRFGIKKGDPFTRKGPKKKQTKTKRKPKGKTRQERLERDPDREEFRMLGIESWEELYCGLGIRGMILIWNSFVRKYISLPLAIIAKNIGRILLLQPPEWAEDRTEWENEIHVLCNDEGLLLGDGEISIVNLPAEWWDFGFQIKVLYPLELKPWQTPNTQRQTEKYAFLRATWGLANYPWGPARTNQPLVFWGPIFNHLGKISKRVAKARLEGKAFEVIKSLLNTKIEKQLTRVLRNANESIKWLKESIKQVQESILVLKRIILNRIKKNPRLKEIGGDESSETQNSINQPSNKKINDSLSEIRSRASTNSEEQIQNLINRTSTIKNEIERLTEEKKRGRPGLNNNPNNKKKNNNLELPKNFWKLVKRKTVRLISKCKYFSKLFIEKIYKISLDIFLYIIKIPRIHVRKNFFEKDISNTKTKQQRITLRKIVPKFASLPTLSSLSQAYVFYKLSQSLVNDKLRSVLQYRGTSFFLKTPIKDFFERQGILHSELKDKKTRNFGTNPWKNWLRGQSPYNLSKVYWEQVGAQTWRNKVNRRHTSQTTTLNKGDASENLLHSKKQDDSEVYSLVRNQKTKFKKKYKYDLLAYNYISSETEKDSKWPLQDLFPEEILWKTYFKDYIVDKKLLDQLYRNTSIINYRDGTRFDKDYEKYALGKRVIDKILFERVRYYFKRVIDKIFFKNSADREVDFYKQYLDRLYLHTKSVDNYFDKVYLDLDRHFVGTTFLENYLAKVFMSLKKARPKKYEKQYMPFDWKIFEQYINIINLESVNKPDFDRNKKYVIKNISKPERKPKPKRKRKRKPKPKPTEKEKLTPDRYAIMRVKDQIEKKFKRPNDELQKPWKAPIKQPHGVALRLGPSPASQLKQYQDPIGTVGKPRRLRNPSVFAPTVRTDPEYKEAIKRKAEIAKLTKVITPQKKVLFYDILPPVEYSDEVLSKRIKAHKRFRMWMRSLEKVSLDSHKNSLLWYEHTEKILKKFCQLKHRGFNGFWEETSDPILNKTQNKKFNRIWRFWIGMNKPQIVAAPRANSNEEQEDWFFPEFMLRKKIYQRNCWLSPTKLLLSNFERPVNYNPTKIQFVSPWKKKLIKKIIDPIPTAIRKLYDRRFIKAGVQYRSSPPPRITGFHTLKSPYLGHSLHMQQLLPESVAEQLNLTELLKKTQGNFHRKKKLMLYMQMRELEFDKFGKLFSKSEALFDWLERGYLTFEPLLTASLKNLDEFVTYQAIHISLVHKSKQQPNQGSEKKKEKDHFDLLVPEMILSSRRRRELRILNSLNYNFKNRNGVNRNSDFCKENNRQSWGHFLAESKDLDREKKELMKLKFFLWPNFRLEDLACMNRYWFDTNNGSRFSLLRIYMYPRFKIR